MSLPTPSVKDNESQYLKGIYGLKNDKLAFWFQGLKGHCHIAVCYKAYEARIVIYKLLFYTLHKNC